MARLRWSWLEQRRQQLASRLRAGEQLQANLASLRRISLCSRDRMHRRWIVCAKRSRPPCRLPGSGPRRWPAARGGIRRRPTRADQLGPCWQVRHRRLSATGVLWRWATTSSCAWFPGGGQRPTAAEGPSSSWRRVRRPQQGAGAALGQARLRGCRRNSGPASASDLLGERERLLGAARVQRIAASFVKQLDGVGGSRMDWRHALDFPAA